MRRRSYRRARRRRGFAVLGAVSLAALPVGLAHLASNAVPVTRAGEVTRPVVIPAELTAVPGRVVVDPLGQPVLDGLAASVVSGGVPIYGLELEFVVSGETVCAASTDARGFVSCPGVPAPSATRPGTYVVEYAGAGALGSLQDSAPLAWPDIAVATDGSTFSDGTGGG